MLFTLPYFGLRKAENKRFTKLFKMKLQLRYISDPGPREEFVG